MIERWDHCPEFCGTSNGSTPSLQNCSSCPWGWRATGGLDCEPCSLPLKTYDWLYLGFIVLVPLLLHSFFIEYCAREKSTRKLLAIQHLCSCAECAMAALLTALLMEPRGRLTLMGCGVEGLRDWYPLFYNPTIRFTQTLHCTHEVVYPLYSIPLVYHAFSLVCLFVLRSAALCPLRCRKTGASSAVYAALYFYPILSLTHVIFAGLIYYSFPYLLLLAALTTNAIHFALHGDLNIRSLFLTTFRSARNISVVITHCLLYVYCIGCLTQFAYPARDCALLLLVPVPPLFYILTVGVTDPQKAFI